LIEGNNDVERSSNKLYSSRYLLTKHSRNEHHPRRHHGTNSIAESPRDYLSNISPMSPSPSADSPSPRHSLVSPIHLSTPASSSSPSPTPAPSTHPPTLASSSSPSPTPVPSIGVEYLPLAPDKSGPPPPPPSQPINPFQIFKPITSAPTPSPSFNSQHRRKEAIILAACVSGIIILIAFALCYREAKSSKVKKDDGPLLVLTSNDYSGGMFIYVHVFYVDLVCVCVCVCIDKTQTAT